MTQSGHTPPGYDNAALAIVIGLLVVFQLLVALPPIVRAIVEISLTAPPESCMMSSVESDQVCRKKETEQ